MERAIQNSNSSGKPREWIFALICGLPGILLTVSLFPPFDLAEAAYVFLLPFFFWSLRQPGWKLWLFTGWLVHWIAWTFILIWLRHVTWAGLLLVSALLALFPTVWLVLVRTCYPRLNGLPAGRRLGIMVALSGAWVLSEWVRGWLLSGFPWLPLAASQWLRPAMLQLAPWTGAWGVSFLLVFFNLAIARYLQLIFRDSRKKNSRPAAARLYFHFCPEFYVALLLFFGSFSLFLYSLPEQRQRLPLFRAGIIQPWVPANLKWDREEALNNLQILKWQTEAVALLEPDLILWPEAATPIPVKDDQNSYMLNWVDDLISPLGVPLLMGNLASDRGTFYNGIFLFEPGEGLHDTFYAKIRLVPFGEYVPLRNWIPFVDKVIPFTEDIIPGRESITLPLNLNGETLSIGGLVCYEDIFPQLGLQLVRAGADFIFVVTNDAWYGEEAGAYQHAAHSVLRAVETRRPVIRCGNHGWSGWIDEYGNIHHVLVNQEGTIYFRGSEIMDVSRQPEWSGRNTFFVKWGNWFVAACALSLLFLYGVRRR